MMKMLVSVMTYGDGAGDKSGEVVMIMVRMVMMMMMTMVAMTMSRVVIITTYAMMKKILVK